MRHAAAATLLALLAGCGGTPDPERDGARVEAAAPPPPASVTAVYRCADGSTLHVAFDNRAGTATLRQDGAALGTIAQQRAASGIWYAGNGMTLRGKGSDATFERAGRTATRCRADG